MQDPKVIVIKAIVYSPIVAMVFMRIRDPDIQGGLIKHMAACNTIADASFQGCFMHNKVNYM